MGSDELLIAVLAGLVILLAIWVYWTRRDIPLDWPNHVDECRHCRGALSAMRGGDSTRCLTCECVFENRDHTTIVRGEGCPGA